MAESSSASAFEFPEQSRLSFETCWRNIYTVVPAQNLYDDLVSHDNEHILFALDAATSGIDHSQPAGNRVFQYGAVEETIACFDPKYFAKSRFTPGTFGVFYGALEEQTSIIEAVSRHVYLFGSNMAKAREPVTTDRKMYVCQVASKRSVDLRRLVGSHPELVNTESYDYCNEVGAQAVKANIELLIYQSARTSDGTCIASFTSSAVKAEQFRYYLKMSFAPGHDPEVFKMTKVM